MDGLKIGYGLCGFQPLHWRFCFVAYIPFALNFGSCCILHFGFLVFFLSILACIISRAFGSVS